VIKLDVMKTKIARRSKCSRVVVASHLHDRTVNLQDSDRICVNVSGQYYEFRREVLARHPDTLLGNEDKRREFYDSKRQEYFFDRHRPSFEAIFGYYMYGGRLKRPHQVADDIFLAEITFHQLEDHVITAYKMSEGYTEDEVFTPDHRMLKVHIDVFGFKL